VLVQQWAQRLGGGRVVGIDLEEESIQAGWAQHTAPNLQYRVMEAENLPFADGEFELASAIEVLEHVPDPEHTVARWRAARAATCSCPCRMSRCGGCSTWRAAPTGRIWETPLGI